MRHMIYSRTSERFLHVLDDTSLIEVVAFSVVLKFLRCQKLYFSNHFMLQLLAEISKHDNERTLVLFVEWVT
jgi:hypothetical protein